MNKTYDRYASVVLFIFAAAFIWEGTKISDSAYGSNVGPDIFPIGLGIILLLLCARLFYESLRTKNEVTRKTTLDYKGFLIIFGSAVVYALLLEPLGYILTTFLFLIISFQVMKRGNWIKGLLIAGVFSFGVYYLFVNVLEGSLPGLPIWFR